MKGEGNVGKGVRQKFEYQLRFLSRRQRIATGSFGAEEWHMKTGIEGDKSGYRVQNEPEGKGLEAETFIWEAWQSCRCGTR